MRMVWEGMSTSQGLEDAMNRAMAYLVAMAGICRGVLAQETVGPKHEGGYREHYALFDLLGRRSPTVFGVPLGVLVGQRKGRSVQFPDICAACGKEGL